jgi:putative FmdB family regulatory protein
LGELRPVFLILVTLCLRNSLMPIYEYQCAACNHHLEALQKMNDKPLVDCPKCEKAELKKRISASAFRLKGDGWYETDFKTGKKKNLAGDKSPASSSAGGE